jgi:hypothetical protein
MALRKIKLRGDVAADWTSVNPVLALREVGLETDTRKHKIGDGVTAWSSLAYSVAGSVDWDDITDIPAIISGITGLASTGLIARTGSGTVAVRTLAAPAAGITVSNGDGVSGNPTLALADDLAALEALSGTNTIYYRSAANTWTAVTIGGHLSFSGGTLNVVTAGSGAAIPRMDTSTVWSNTFTVVGNFTVGNGTTNYRGIFKGNGPYAVGLTQGASNGYVFLGTTASATPDFILSDGSGVELLRVAVSGALQPTTGTTASAANLYQSASGAAVLRSTSSKRYKRDIETLEPARADAVLAARPIWYRSTAVADNPEWGYYGLLAEEVAKIDPRLVSWAYRDSDYRLVKVKRGKQAKFDKKGEMVAPATPPVLERRLKKGAKLVPDGVQYERFVVLLLDIAKRQGERIDALERQLRGA